MRLIPMARIKDPSLRDPAWSRRVFWFVVACVILWPALVSTEFRPWVFFEAQNLKVTTHFLSEFFPPALNLEFLELVAREAWRTVAIATAGTFLALLFAIPLTLLSTTVLSVSSLSGRMRALPFVVRQLIRWLLILLRSVPELIWARVLLVILTSNSKRLSASSPS